MTTSVEQPFETLKSKVMDSIGEFFPYETRTRKLVLDKIWVDDNLDTNDIKSQLAAHLADKTWGVKVRGKFSLIDKTTGSTLNTGTTTLATLPKLTPRYSYILPGGERQVANLFRLRSGVYTRVKDNGEIETEFNMVRGPAGPRFEISLDPAKRKFSLVQGGASIPLYPILHTMGVADEQLKKDWGNELFEANLPKGEKQFQAALSTFYKKTANEEDVKPDSLAGLAQYVRNHFDQTVLLPHSAALTLGKPFEKVTGEVLAIAAQNQLGALRGTRKPDDRDSLDFKDIVSVEDLVPEMISKRKKQIQNSIRKGLERRTSVSEILGTGEGSLFNRPVDEFFKTSLSERTSQTNPLIMLSAMRKTTPMSPEHGGIKSDRQISEGMSAISPSHFGFLDPNKTPEGERTGVSVNLGIQARKIGKDLAIPVYQLATGKTVLVKAPEFHHGTAVLPDQVTWVGGKPKPVAPEVKMKMPGGNIELRPWKEATQVMPSAKGMFDYTTNMIPFLPCDQGNRVSMADKQMEQVIALKDREAPLVQCRTDSGKQNETFEKRLGSFSSHHSPIDGKVLSVTPDEIVVGQGKEKHTVHIYNHFPLNNPKSQFHSYPTVKEGEEVKKGQLLADSSFTKDGVLAMGKNLRVGYLSKGGYNFEDGIVISESAAKKLTSEHLHKMELELDPETDKMSSATWQAVCPTAAVQQGKKRLDALDADGVIRVGSKVEPGQILAAAIGKRTTAEMEADAFRNYGSRAIKQHKDKALIWDSDHVGEVVRVVKDPNGKGAQVHVQTIERAEMADKLSGRSGNKGVISQILPDDKMPFTIDPVTKERKPLEILLNGLGVVTRITPGQLLETAAGKIAEKTGKPYIVDNFESHDPDYRSKVENELKAHGLSDQEEVYDPEDTRRPLGSVLVGKQYILKHEHQVEKKLLARGGGTSLAGKGLPYDIDGQPTRGGEIGGQGFGALELYTMLGWNARANIREMSTFKSDKQTADFWNIVQSGGEPPPPTIPFAYRKFEALLKGLGVNVTKRGTNLQLMPFTDQQIVAAAGGKAGELPRANLLIDSRHLKEEKGGLFDPKVTGGLQGTKWSYITLHEPIPNPLFVGHKTGNGKGPVPILLGMRVAEVEEVLKGERALNGLTGGKAIAKALKMIDVDDMARKTKESLAGLKGPDLDRANKKLKVLQALQDAHLTPDDAYMLHHVPVLPPIFRPVTFLDGRPQPYSLNGLYKNVAMANSQLASADPAIYPESAIGARRVDLYEKVKQLQGVGKATGYDSAAPGGKRELTSILGIIAGTAPKRGFFQSKLIKRRQDLSIRAAITPEPRLGLDEIGLPTAPAMELYKPFVVAKMNEYGFKPLDAEKEMRQLSPTAVKALEATVKERPLLLKRDPALHKFSVMAFNPVLVGGKTIQIHPLVCGGFNADFDGDTCLGDVIVVAERPQIGDKDSEGEGMPHTGSIISYQIIDIAHFPRTEGSQVIKSLNVIEYDVPAHVYVPAYLAGAMKLLPATKFSIHTNCEEWVTKTRNGRTLTTSSDHSLALLDPETLEVVKMPPRDALGKCMPVMHSLQESNLWGQVKGGTTLRSNGRDMLEDIQLDRNVGWFIGTTIGDGWVTSASGLATGAALAHTDNSLDPVRIRWGREGIRLCPGTAPAFTPLPHVFEGVECSSGRTTLHSGALGRWLEPMIGKGARNKHLPPRFLELPLEYRRGLFCGLIDTDGTANWAEKGQFSLSFTSTSSRLCDEMQVLGISLGLHASRSEYINREKPVYIATFSIRPVQDARWIQLESPQKQSALEKLWASEEIEYGRNDFAPLPERAREELSEHLRQLGAALRPPKKNKAAFSQYVVLQRGQPTLTRTSVEILRQLLVNRSITPYLRRWFEIALDTSIAWDVVEEAKPTGEYKTMYDLTVPEAWTFTMADGAVVWDTMAGTVPMTKEAIEEARNMFPSKNLFSPTTGGVMYTPNQDMLLGLHLLTKWGKPSGKTFATVEEAKLAQIKGDIQVTDQIQLKGAKGPTTLGRLSIASSLPSGFSLSSEILHNQDWVIDKSKMKSMTSSLAKGHPQEFATVINRLKDLGNEQAFKSGFSFGLEDFKPLPERDKILSDAHERVAQMKKTTHDKATQNQRAIEIYQEATTKLDEAARAAHKASGGKNRLMTMVFSGARGSPEQMRQMIAAPMLMQGSDNRTIPIPVTRSYAEGLDLGDYWNAQHGARKGTLQRAQGTSEPGALSKEILNSSMSTLVVSKDCRTSQGVHMPIDSKEATPPDIFDRYTAAPYTLKDGKVVPAATLVTPELVNKLREAKVDKLLVRSPLKCAHGKGICQKCYGLSADGVPYPIGTNIGVIAGQSMGEPATQMAMDAFHTGGLATGRGGASVDRISRLNEILHMPATLKNEATLATISGKVTDVRKSAAGGEDVFIGDKIHHVKAEPSGSDGAPGRSRVHPQLKVGTTVSKGQSLSYDQAPINPHHLLKTTGDIHTVQNWMVKELHDKLYKQEGVRQRNLEVVIRNLTNLTKIEDGAHSHWTRADVAPLTEVEEYNRGLPEKTKKVEHTPILTGMGEVPLRSNDWLAQLNFEDLRNTIARGAAQGWKSELHGANPIPGIAQGASFGKPPPDVKAKRPGVY
jgi:DNA-directed RNA polymerase beta subunit/DNA-directed RNA polymerase beta' subunit